MSQKIETTAWINRSPAEVFAFIADIENTVQYMTGLIEVRWGNEERGLGAHIVSTHMVLGKKIEMVTEWTRFEKDVAICATSVESPFGASLLTELKPENGGTRVNRTLMFAPKGFFGSITVPVVRRSAERNARRDLEMMKDLLEMQVKEPQSEAA